MMGDSVVTTAAVNDIISISDCDSKYFRYLKCFMVCQIIIMDACVVDRGIVNMHIMNRLITVRVLVCMCVAKRCRVQSMSAGGATIHCMRRVHTCAVLCIMFSIMRMGVRVQIIIVVVKMLCVGGCRSGVVCGIIMQHPERCCGLV